MNCVKVFREFLESDHKKAREIRRRNTKEIPDEYIEDAYIGNYASEDEFIREKVEENYFFNTEKIPSEEMQNLRTWLDYEAMYQELVEFRNIVKIGNYYFDVSEMML